METQGLFNCKPFLITSFDKHNLIKFYQLRQQNLIMIPMKF